MKTYKQLLEDIELVSGHPRTSKSKQEPINENFGVPSYKAADFSSMNKKTADVLVKELNRISRYLDPGYDMASDALEDIKQLVKTLKTVKSGAKRFAKAAAEKN